MHTENMENAEETCQAKKLHVRQARNNQKLFGTYFPMKTYDSEGGDSGSVKAEKPKKEDKDQDTNTNFAADTKPAEPVVAEIVPKEPKVEKAEPEEKA